MQEMSHLHGRSRSRTGQAAVELAVAAPLLFLMLFGLIDFGRAYFQYIAVVNATREGARFAAYGFVLTSNAASPPQNTIQGRIKIADGGLSVPNDAAHIKIQFYDTHCAGCDVTPVLCAHYNYGTNAIAWDPGYAAPGTGVQGCPYEGDAVKITVLSDFQPITPMMSQLMGALKLTVSAETRIE
jgi:hypothetical protein